MGDPDPDAEFWIYMGELELQSGIEFRFSEFRVRTSRSWLTSQSMSGNISSNLEESITRHEILV